MGDYIKLDRKIIDWEWYQDINTCRVFIHFLLKANWKEAKFKGYTVPRGSFVSSYPVLQNETRLTEREIRTAILHLKTTGELTTKSTNKFTIFTVCNYDLYQSDRQTNDIQATDKRQSNDILTSAIEEVKNNKNIKKDIPKGISKESHFVPPTVDQVKEYCQSRSNNVDPNKFVDFYSSKGWMVGKTKMKDWKASVRTWEAKDGGKNARTGESAGATENGFMQKARAAGYDPSKLEFNGF